MPTFEITSPDGKVYEIEAPKGATKDQALAKLQEQLGSAQAQPPVESWASVNVPQGQMQTGQILPQGSQTVGGIPENIPDSLSLGNVLEPAAAIASGLITEPMAGLAGIAATRLGGADMGTAAINTVRQATEIPLSSEGKEGMEALGEFIRPGINLLTGAEDYLGDAGNDLGGPVLGAVGKTIPTAALTALGPVISRTGKVIKASGVSKAKAKHKEMIDALVTPDKTKSVKIDEVGRTVEHGRFFKKSTVTLSPREQVVSHQVSQVPGVAGKNSLQGNHNIIRDHNTKLAKKLDARVTKEDISVPHIVVAADIDDAVIQVIKDNPIIPVGKGGMNDTLARMAAQAKKIISSKPQTAKGLLDARKEFDAFAIKQRANVFDTPLDPVMKIGTLAIRDSMNGRVATVIPKFKKELGVQSALFEAVANIAPKAAKQGNTVMERVWQHGAEFLGFRNKIMQTLAVAAGTSVLGAATAFAPAISLTMGAGGVLYLGGKALSAAQSRIAIGKMAMLASQAIGATKNKKIILQLKADRAALLQILKDIPEDSEQ